ncbi:Carbon monoxide dehydrogenase subunit G [Sphingomonas laterariae]|uniref:Carbon monoxide dehydrogenase subunit G n=1 Tax=Edaphosphingomonas laterariae TaxID=861865 RepID=A0A239DR28_9SPHN|nr:SRPBCC family protein [Sphingomonas laterariae]SNS35095.1 Carbon monoxide dehydrogenase subunit G [Sphingomonas laterariae]
MSDDLPQSAPAQWFDFRAVGPDFVNTAPTRYVTVSSIDAPVQAVWDAFCDPASWPHWFPHVERVVHEGAPGVGMIRKSWVAGCAHDETMVIWDEPRAWGYIINKATEPLAAAQIELTTFDPLPEGGTRVTWTLACEPLEGLSFLSADRDFPSFLQAMLDEAMGNLARYLAAPKPA